MVISRRRLTENLKEMHGIKKKHVKGMQNFCLCQLSMQILCGRRCSPVVDLKLARILWHEAEYLSQRECDVITARPIERPKNPQSFRNKVFSIFPIHTSPRAMFGIFLKIFDFFILHTFGRFYSCLLLRILKS